MGKTITLRLAIKAAQLGQFVLNPPTPLGVDVSLTPGEAQRVLVLVAGERHRAQIAALVREHTRATTTTMAEDPRFGGGTLEARLQHANTRRAEAEQARQAAQSELRTAAERYQETIRTLQQRVDQLETQLAERAFFEQPPEPEPEGEIDPVLGVTVLEPTEGSICRRELCTDLAEANGYCREHRWLAEIAADENE